MEELRKCPLCNGNVEHRRNSTTSGDIKCARTVWCVECNCGLAYFGTKDEIATAWNTRAEPWDIEEWPVQTHMRSKTMDEHIEKIKCLFGNKLSPWIKITPETDFEADTEYAWCKKGHKPMCGDIELHFEGGYEFTHYMPIPPIPEN